MSSTSDISSGSLSRTGSATPTSPSASAGSSISQTAPTTSFSLPPPPPNNGGGGSNNGNGGGFGGGNNTNSIASSASLYLYTFLATLVLLLGVSAAIVIRSLVLRRRHRRMIEEAIRNGTWIPPAPSPGGGGPRGRVDLSKKPKMWDAWCGGGLVGAGTGIGTGMGAGAAGEKMQQDIDWETIKPFSASYIGPPLPTLAASRNPSSPHLTNGQTQNPSSESNAGSSSQRGAAARARNISRTVAHFLRPTSAHEPPFLPSSPAVDPAHSRENIAMQQTFSQSQQHLHTQSPNSGTVPAIRVAVLIAMPTPHKSPFIPSTTASGPGEGSHPGSAGSGTRGSDMDDEVELPHIEFGIADLPVVASHLHDGDDEGLGGGGGGGAADGRKVSMGSEGSDVGDVEANVGQGSLAVPVRH